jgi:hypothetical protein
MIAGILAKLVIKAFVLILFDELRHSGDEMIVAGF